MDLIVKTHSDQVYAVSRFAKFSSNPTDKHWIALKKVLYYLQRSKVLGLCCTYVLDHFSFSD